MLIQQSSKHKKGNVSTPEQQIISFQETVILTLGLCANRANFALTSQSCTAVMMLLFMMLYGREYSLVA